MFGVRVRAGRLLTIRPCQPLYSWTMPLTLGAGVKSKHTSRAGVAGEVPGMEDGGSGGSVYSIGGRLLRDSAGECGNPLHATSTCGWACWGGRSWGGVHGVRTSAEYSPRMAGGREVLGDAELDAETRLARAVVLGRALSVSLSVTRGRYDSRDSYICLLSQV